MTAGQIFMDMHRFYKKYSDLMISLSIDSLYASIQCLERYSLSSYKSDPGYFSLTIQFSDLVTISYLNHVVSSRTSIGFLPR